MLLCNHYRFNQGKLIMEKEPVQNLSQEAARTTIDHLDAADAVERLGPCDDAERALILRGIQQSREVGVAGYGEEGSVTYYSDGSSRVYDDEEGIDYELPA